MTELKKSKKYQKHLDAFYQKELGKEARFSMITSLTPVDLTSEEIKGFKKRYKIIRKFQKITNNLFKKSLSESSLKEIRDLVLNEVNPEFALEFHQELYKKRASLPYFFRTDECIPGKIIEIQSPASGWGMLDVLQRSLNKACVSRKFSKIVKKLIKGKPLVFHLIDTSSNILGMNYFMARTRKYGLKYVGWDPEASFRNVNFINTHSFVSEVTHGCFFDFLKRYYSGNLIFNLFPSIIFDEKIPLTFPFREKTKDLYSDDIREIFPFTSLVSKNTVQLEDGKRVSIKAFSNYPRSKRRYYLKYAGADEKIKWGSRAVYGLAHCNKSQSRALLAKASEGFEKKEYWILQKEYHRKEELSYISGKKMKEKKLYSKYSAFYGPEGFMGGFVMSDNFHKVHGQDDAVVRLIA